MNVSRRDLFAIFARRRRPGSTPPARSNENAAPAEPQPAPAPTDFIAIVQGRHCIALTSFCSVCAERCPVPGAMRSERGMPMVVADVCTGCGVCKEVCPAPTNAILMLKRRPAPPRS